MSIYILTISRIALLLQLRIFHFNPPGVLHPITTIYELNYGETEMKQGNYCNYVKRGLGTIEQRYFICKIQNYQFQNFV